MKVIKKKWHIGMAAILSDMMLLIETVLYPIITGTYKWTLIIQTVIIICIYPIGMY